MKMKTLKCYWKTELWEKSGCGKSEQEARKQVVGNLNRQLHVKGLENIRIK